MYVHIAQPLNISMTIWLMHSCIIPGVTCYTPLYAVKEVPNSSISVTIYIFIWAPKATIQLWETRFLIQTHLKIFCYRSQKPVQFLEQDKAVSLSYMKAQWTQSLNTMWGSDHSWRRATGVIKGAAIVWQ